METFKVPIWTAIDHLLNISAPGVKVIARNFQANHQKISQTNRWETGLGLTAEVLLESHKHKQVC